jgi:hypothetical protein
MFLNEINLLVGARSGSSCLLLRGAGFYGPAVPPGRRGGNWVASCGHLAPPVH